MEQAANYIPQAAPFIMIDELVQADEMVTQTRFQVKEGHLFVENGYFTEPGLVENMAQTAAAGTGKRAAAANTPPPVGFIGAIKALEIVALPPVGANITTTTQLSMQVMNASVVQATVVYDGQEIARAEFKIFLQ